MNSPRASANLRASAVNTPAEPDLSRIAMEIGEPARAAMLSALMGGVPLAAGELARRAGVSASTASGHLARMVEAGLVRRRTDGRRRYYALASADVAAALEALARIAPPHRGAKSERAEDAAFRFARTCYDHLAGALGVRVTDTLLERGIIAGRGFEVTEAGEDWLREQGIDVVALRARRRTLSRP